MRALSEAFVGPLATAEAERKKQDQEVAIQRAAIMKDLMAGRQPAISDISGMAGQFPGLFPAGTEQRFRQALPENIEAAKQRDIKAKADSAWAESEYKKRQEDNAQKERDNAVLEASQEADARHAEQARKKDEAQRQHDARHAERERQRASTPLAQMSRGVREMAPGLEMQGFDVEGIAHEALRQLPATGGNAAVAIQQAILAAYQRGMRIQQEDMARMQVFSEMMQGSR